MGRRTASQPRLPIADGKLAAASALGRTVMHPDVTQVLDDYRRLSTDEQRARYADHFLSRTAHVLDEIWPAFYELLKQVEEGELYKEPGYVGGDQVFGSFKEYFEYRVGRPYDTWAELESTYHYAQDYKPELLEAAFPDAIGRMQAEIADIKRRLDRGGVINVGPGRIPTDSNNADNISISPGRSFGSSAKYLTRRIARDRPDIAARMGAGEFPSAAAAARAAGISQRPVISVRLDDAESAARTLRKHMPADVLAELVRILTEQEN